MTIRISAELSHICPLEGIRFHAEALASCGYYRVWAPDTLVSQWEAWLAASVILHATDRLRIGVGVMNPYTRHPVLMAQMGAFMQHLSNGRLALSIGKGIPRFLEKAGIQPHETAVNEAITIVRRLMSGQRTSHSGDAYTIDGLRLRVHPPQKQVPIYRAAVSLDGWKDAMEVADGIATFWSDEAFEMRRQLMGERSFPTVVLIPFALSRRDFFTNPVTSAEALKERVGRLDAAGFEEVMVAYAEVRDLEAAARVLI